MLVFFSLTKLQLKTMSSILTNMLSGWILAMFATNDPLTLLWNGILAIMFYKLVIAIEEFIEET